MVLLTKPIRNGLTYDPNPMPRATVRLSTPSLRSQQMWYILHWIVSGDSALLPWPDNEESNTLRQVIRREAKHRRQEKRRENRKAKERTVPEAVIQAGTSVSSHGTGPR